MNTPSLQANAAGVEFVMVDTKAIQSAHYERLTRDNAILLIVDHQVGLFTGVRDIDTLQLKHNIVGLAKAAQALKIPVIVTTTTERMWGTNDPRTPGSAGWHPAHPTHHRERLG
jgi:nicotinamidase-related amidase